MEIFWLYVFYNSHDQATTLSAQCISVLLEYAVAQLTVLYCMIGTATLLPRKRSVLHYDALLTFHMRSTTLQRQTRRMILSK